MTARKKMTRKVPAKTKRTGKKAKTDARSAEDSPRKDVRITRQVEDYQWNYRIPEELWTILNMRESAPRVLRWLDDTYSPVQVLTQRSDRRDRLGRPSPYKAWWFIGLFYRDTDRPLQAHRVLWEWYQRCLQGQRQKRKWWHKGAPLVWMNDVHLQMGQRCLAKRMMMLTLIEDAIAGKGILDTERGGSYLRLAWQHRMPDADIARHAQRAYEICTKDPKSAMFPEHVLLELDDDWISEFPTADEASIYVASAGYVSFLLDRLGKDQGRSLEALARTCSLPFLDFGRRLAARPTLLISMSSVLSKGST